MDLDGTKRAARRQKSALVLLISGAAEPEDVISVLQAAEGMFADRLSADGLDLAEHGARFVSEPFPIGQDIAIYVDLGDACGRAVDHWVDVVAEGASRLRRSREWCSSGVFDRAVC